MERFAGQKKVRGGGTLHHMAPELVGNYLQKAAGNAAVPQDGFPCDMWALGVMLAELLTGKLPFWPKTGFDYAGMARLLANWVCKSFDMLYKSNIKLKVAVKGCRSSCKLINCPIPHKLSSASCQGKPASGRL